MNDGSLIAENAGIGILMVILNLLQVIIVLILLLSMNLYLGLLVLIMIPAYYLVNGEMRFYVSEERTAFATLQNMVIQNIKGFREIKIFNKYDYFTNQFQDGIHNGYLPKTMKVVNCEVLMTGITNLMTIFLPAIILIFGAYLAYDQQITIGTLMVFYTYIFKLIEPIGNLADAYQGSRKAMGAADRVYDFIFDIEEEREASSAAIDTIERVTVEIQAFSQKEKTILRNVHFQIGKGDRLFITGASGTGKSTILKLLLNFYPLTHGCIKINGRDITTLSKGDLYKKMSILFQEPFVFQGTVRDNLTLGEDFSDEALYEVLKMVMLDDYIAKKGLNFEIKESGSNMSGGERQRLALARVLLRKPSLLILDEATSALDFETEKHVIDNLDKYLERNNGILVAVSHNDEIKRICNHIYPMPAEEENGMVVGVQN